MLFLTIARLVIIVPTVRMCVCACFLFVEAAAREPRNDDRSVSLQEKVLSGIRISRRHSSGRIGKNAGRIGRRTIQRTDISSDQGHQFLPFKSCTYNNVIHNNKTYLRYIHTYLHMYIGRLLLSNHQRSIDRLIDGHLLTTTIDNYSYKY